jgi:hypothetical protein
MVKTAPEHALWTDSQVWLGRLAAVPLAVAINGCLLAIAVLQQCIIQPVPEPPAHMRVSDPVHLPPKPHLAWPDLRPLLMRPPPPPTPPPPPQRPSPDKKGIFWIYAGIIPPVPIFRQSPYYPEAARRARIQGLVIVEMVVDQTGKVVSARTP